MSKPPFKNIYNIIAKKVSGQSTEIEDKKFEEWLESTPEAKDSYTEIQNIWSNVHFSHENKELISQEEVSEKIWNSTFEKENKKKNRRRNGFKILKLAAIFIVFFAALFIALFVVDINKEEVPQVTTISKQTLPGQKSTITLQDGTIVYLNSGSKISYKSNYNNSVRIIDLEGQAFFEVFKDRSKPFVVGCKNIEVKALGTSFDVNAYKGFPIQVSLLTGSVKVIAASSSDSQKELVLNPGEFFTVNEDGTFKSKGTFNPYEILAWKDGRLIFKDATIREIVPKLELWFGVQIHNYSVVDPNRPFKTTFEKENLDNILMNIGAVLDFDYIIERNKVTIIKKNMPM